MGSNLGLLRLVGDQQLGLDGGQSKAFKVSFLHPTPPGDRHNRCVLNKDILELDSTWSICMASVSISRQQFLQGASPSSSSKELLQTEFLKPRTEAPFPLTLGNLDEEEEVERGRGARLARVLLRATSESLLVGGANSALFQLLHSPDVTFPRFALPNSACSK